MILDKYKVMKADTKNKTLAVLSYAVVLPLRKNKSQEIFNFAII